MSLTETSTGDGLAALLGWLVTCVTVAILILAGNLVVAGSTAGFDGVGRIF